MDILPKSLIHYRLYDEIDTFVETGYCSYWNDIKFIKPIVKEDSNRNWFFEKKKSFYKILYREFNETTKIIVYFDIESKTYYYQHYENNILIINKKSTAYMDIHDLIIFEMNNFRNLIY